MHADSARVRSRRSEPAHVDRLGLGAVLECLRRRDPAARLGDLLRPAPGQQGPVPGLGQERLFQYTRHSRPGHLEAGALHFYQLAIPAPTPPKGSFDTAAAGRGKEVFNGRGKCSTCHVPPLFTEPGHNLHTPAEVGVDSFQADRSPTLMYRTAPLAGLWTHQKGGFYHDGRFATLPAVIDHYDSTLRLGLTAQEKGELVEYLKSL